MTSKRQAATELNQNNWDKEDEPIEPGEFREASEEELKTRVIKKARRKQSNITTNSDEEKPNSVFSNFSGFSGLNANSNSSTSKSPFSFLSNLTKKPTKPNSNVNQIADKVVDSTENPVKETECKTVAELCATEWTDEFKESLVELNTQFLDWIKIHIERNPCCVILDVLKNYRKHFDRLVEDDKQRKKDTPKNVSTTQNIEGKDESDQVSTTTKPEPATVSFNFGYRPPAAAGDSNKLNGTATSNKNDEQPSTFSKTVSSILNSTVSEGENMKFGFKPTISGSTFTNFKSNVESTQAGNKPPLINATFSFGNSKISTDSKEKEKAADSKAEARQEQEQSSSTTKPKGFIFASTEAPASVSNTNFFKAESTTEIGGEKKQLNLLSKAAGAEKSAANLNEAEVKSSEPSGGQMEEEREKPPSTTGFFFASAKPTTKSDNESSKAESSTDAEGVKKTFSFTTASKGFSFASPKADSKIGDTPFASKEGQKQFSFGPSSSGFSFAKPKFDSSSGTEESKKFTFTPSSSGFSFLNAAASAKSDNDATSVSSSATEVEKKSFIFAPSTSGFSFSNAISAQNKTEGAEKTKLSFIPSSSGFSFSKMQAPTSSADKTNADDGNEEDEEPPKLEFKEFVEDDAIFTQKCKVYIKKGNNYSDHGKGTLYLKAVKDSGKTQLIVRAENSLGSIILNMLLTAGLPAQRSQKKDVMLIGLPTPDAIKTTAILLRVGSEADADQLLAAIKEHQK